jgi:hypothetical protein
MTTVLNNGQPVTNEADLYTAISAADGEAANSGVYEIELAAGATIDLTSALEAINLKTGVTLDIGREMLAADHPQAPSPNCVVEIDAH